MSQTISVNLVVTDDQCSRLEELLRKRKGFKNMDGSKPFEEWTIETLLGSLMIDGCSHVINRCIHFEEYCQELYLEKETPAAGTARESCD